MRRAFLATGGRLQSKRRDTARYHCGFRLAAPDSPSAPLQGLPHRGDLISITLRNLCKIPRGADIVRPRGGCALIFLPIAPAMAAKLRLADPPIRTFGIHDEFCSGSLRPAARRNLPRCVGERIACGCNGTRFQTHRRCCHCQRICNDCLDRH